MSSEGRYLETRPGFSADSLLRVINDILDFSKIEAGRLDLDVADFDLGEVLDDILKLMTPAADQGGLKLSSSISPEVPRWLGGDPMRLRQIIVNLVGNAIKFTRGGEIALRVSTQSEIGDGLWLLFEVQDSGIGIPVDKQQVIFEAFAQADGSTWKSPVRRNGFLGLTISAKLVVGDDEKQPNLGRQHCREGKHISLHGFPGKSHQMSRRPAARFVRCGKKSSLRHCLRKETLLATRQDGEAKSPTIERLT